MTLGGVLGLPISIATASANISPANWLIMLIESVLCGVFAGLLLNGYKKK